MKIPGYEEISEEEYDKLPDHEGACFRDYKTDEAHFFRKVQKFPIVFEDEDKKIIVGKSDIELKQKNTEDNLYFAYGLGFPLLVKAVEKAKEVIKNNDK